MSYKVTNQALSQSEDSSDDDEDIRYVEESSESEPELECDLWDVDCKVLGQVKCSRAIMGCHLMATCEKDPDFQPKKRIKLHPNFNPKLIASDLQKKWDLNQPFTSKDFELITTPFKVGVVKNLIENTEFLDELRKQLYEVYFNLRSMDLYEFFQSKDLKYLTDLETVGIIYDFLKNDLKTWVSTVTGFELTQISATCSLYSNTDYLLVHDDQREDRRVAFILYLTDNYGWNQADGGCLHLFSKDQTGQPSEVVRSVVPANNQLIFFPVTNDSYHEVGEVTSLNKYRLSINGWFHVKSPPIFEIPLYTPMKNSLYSNDYRPSKVVDIDLETWIRDDYLNSKAVKLIQRHIEENSEISLKGFFKEESFNEVLSTLQGNDISWIKVAPVNRYRYEIAELNHLPYVIERLIDLFSSNKMFKLLGKYTDLELDNEKACMKFELQRWTPGSYALLTEYDWNKTNELDLIIHFGCKLNNDVIGARTHYVTIEDEVQNALITIEPEENNLNVVYRDSARFTKYFSKQSKCQCFYTLICSYIE